MLVHDVNNLAEATTAIMQPTARDGLETALHILPNMAANVLAIYEPAHGSLTGVAALTNFANPMQFICSAIQAGSRLGYQDSAELCAQYLAPVLDAIKFNYLPFGMNLFSTADTLPKNVAYSEPRLQPPPGFKDTTVPGIFSPDTPWSHRNSEPGWVVAPGMQGVQVQPATANLLTPASLAELMGGPNIAPPPPARNMAGPPNAYDENNPLPPPWYPQPLPSPTPPPPAELPLGAAEAPAPRAGPVRRATSAVRARSKPNRQPATSAVRLVRRKAWQALALLMAMVVLTSCGNWRGIANVPLPGGPGSGPGSYTIYVQMPNTMALNGNSRVLVADVFVGTVRAIDLKNWVATLTVDLEKGVRLPKNATAKIGQTSLLGSQHIELAAPPNPSPQLLKAGDTIPLTNSSAYPSTEQTLASLAMVLRGGGIPNLEVIQNEVYKILTGRAHQIRDFLGKLDTFVGPAEPAARRHHPRHRLHRPAAVLRRAPVPTRWTRCSPNSRRW